MLMTDNFDNEPDVVAAIEAGRIVEAIKELRQSRGIGLKEAKDLVEEYRETHNMIDATRAGTGQTFNTVLILALVAVGVYIFKNYF